MKIYKLLFENNLNNLVKINYDKIGLKKYLNLISESEKDVLSYSLEGFLKEEERDYKKRQQRAIEWKQKYNSDVMSLSETLEEFLERRKEYYEYVKDGGLKIDFAPKKVFKNEILFAQNTKLLIENILNEIDNWNGSPIYLNINFDEPWEAKKRNDSYGKLITYLNDGYYNDNYTDYSKTGSIQIQVGNNKDTIFLYSVDENGRIDIGDLLETYGTDEHEVFFETEKNAQDYYNLVKYLQNPKNIQKDKNKITVVYTARPKKDRNLYLSKKEIPNGIFVTSSMYSAEGLAVELQFADESERDVYRIKILQKYLMKTLDIDGGEKQYQVIGNDKMIPVIDIKLI